MADKGKESPVRYGCDDSMMNQLPGHSRTRRKALASKRRRQQEKKRLDLPA